MSIWRISALKIMPQISNAKPVKKSFIGSSIKSVDLDLLKDKGEEVINSALKSGVESNNFRLSKSIVRESFLNSKGTAYEQDHSALTASLECASGNSSCWDIATSQGLGINFKKFGSDAAGLCKESLNAKGIGTGLFDVVLDFNAINELINVLSPSLMANNVVEHNSILEGRVGQEVISPLLTIIDTNELPDGVNNIVMDNEGVLAVNNELFNKGVLHSFMNDLYTAGRMSVKPTGNSGGLMKRGYVSANNWLIKPGDASKEELLDNCLYVYALMGSHTANTVTGDFALSALNAFKYKDGLRTPVRDVMISGNIFDLLKKVMMVGKKSRSDGGLSSPMIRFGQVQVVG